MRVVVGLVVLCLSGGAHAQSLTYAPVTYDPNGPPPAGGQALTGQVDLSRAYIGVTQYNTTDFRDPNAFAGSGIVRLSDVLTASGGVTQSQLSASLVGIAARIDRFADRFREGIALAGSINVLPPNPGDRFAVSFGGAGYDGAGAGSVAVSARVREDIIVYGAAARGPTQTLVKGGVGFSFR